MYYQGELLEADPSMDNIAYTVLSSAVDIKKGRFTVARAIVLQKAPR